MNTEYNKILTKGYQSSLDNTSIENGKIRFTTDTARLYLDNEGTRVEITDIIKGMSEEEIKSIVAPLPKLYLSSDTNKLFIYKDEWIMISGGNTVETIYQNVESIKEDLGNEDISSIGDGTVKGAITVMDSVINKKIWLDNNSISGSAKIECIIREVEILYGVGTVSYEDFNSIGTVFVQSAEYNNMIVNATFDDETKLITIHTNWVDEYGDEVNGNITIAMIIIGI